MSLTTRSRPLTAALGVLALLASFLVPVLGGALPSAAAAVADRERVLTHGHVDGFETTYDAATGRVVLNVKDDTRIYEPGSAIWAPESTTFAWEDQRSIATLPPATGAWSFLGAYGGTQAWLGTQTGSEQAYAPWVGWSTERLNGSLAGTGITPAPGQPVSLDVRIEGPGDVFAFQNGSFGEPINRYVDTTTSPGGTIPVAANAHVHTNWVFTAEGDYTVVVTPSLATTEHGTITGDPATYHFRIGERAPEPVTTSVSVALDAPEHVEGATAVLTAAQDPQTELSTYRWEVAPAGSEEFVPVDGATGATYERVVALADDGARVRAVLLDGDRVAGTSEPVTLDVTAKPAPVTTTVTVKADAAEHVEGATAVITAAQEPLTELSTYRWEVAAAGSDEFVPAEGATGPTYERVVALADDGARVRAVLLDGDRVAGTSEPVTLDVTAKPQPEPEPEPEPEPDPGTSEPNREYVLHRGHVDGFETTYDAARGKLVLSVKDDTRIYEPGSAYRSPAEVTLAYQDERGVQRLPAAEGAWAFLGEHGGTDAWVGTQSGDQQEFLPWVGWSTERLLSSLEGTGITPASGSPVTLDVAVEGPGEVFTFQNDSFGNPVNRYVDTTTSTGRIPVAANAHVHTNWIFTAAGDYHLTVTPSLRTADGKTVPGEPAEYHVRVGAYVPPWQPLTDAELTEANRGDVTLDAASYALGEEATVTSPSLADGQEVVAYVYSEPTSAGTASAQDGEVGVTVPTSVGTGEHKLALYDSASGDLVGWAPFTATTADAQNPGGGTGGGTGGGAGGGAGGGGARGPGAGAPAPEQCIPTPVTSQVRTPARGGVTDGHFDFGSRVEDGRLVATVKDDRKQPPSWVDPGSLTFRLGDAAKDEVPAGFDFLGEAGSTIWSIGQVQESGVPWLGWNTQHSTLVEAAAGPVTYRLDAVDGPGELGVYGTGNFGGVGQKFFGTMPGFGKSTEVTLNQHVHANWAFTEQGVYTVTFTLSVPLKSGGTVSDTATLTFSVGDSSGTTTKTTYVGRTASGEECALSAEQKAALASTGADPVSALALGALLLVTGGVLYGVSRRRGAHPAG
ncbi:TIGR03773 family transporter-associated surface protein [Cellulosimicrobium cellulans]|uniref:TIGR03773 family transporter-associated surface protein n=1 Tax=Cellulosimicrobium cellulans TaxID=1710 RepID=UPI000848BC0B|nr:TIGR03773 family transporter-associated surface protein [Cellulosimicrobium cellulans]